MIDAPSSVVPDSVPFSLSLIHDFALWCGDELVRMSPCSQRLVGFVALHDRPVRRAKVSGTLWLDSSEDRASASLRSALWRIPAPGGVHVLAASPTHLWLNPRIEVDFRTITARARALLDGVTNDFAVLDVARELCCFTAEPLRETAHRLVIRVHLQQGNVAEAIRQYRTYERMLADELGALPSPVMRSLIDSCLGRARLPRAS